MHETNEEDFSFENDNNNNNNNSFTAKRQAFPLADDEFFMTSNKLIVTKLYFFENKYKNISLSNNFKIR